MRALTQKQQVFVKEYLVDLNATQAAIRSGYSAKTATWIGPQLLGKTHVAAAIQAAMDERSQRTEITADNVLQEIAKLAFANAEDVFDADGRLLPVKKMGRRVTAAISAIKVVTRTVPGSEPTDVEHVAEIKFWDKGASLERLGKHLKLFNDVGSAENPLTVRTDEELARRLLELRRK